jgi:hypothetical protein
MKQMFVSGNFDWQANQANPYVMILLMAIQFSIYVYFAAKLVPVVKFIFSIGTVRALVAVGAGGIGFELYEYYIAMPLFVEQLKSLNF